MGVTADIGQDTIDLYRAITGAIGIDDDTNWDTYMIAFDWCYPHDNNTLCGMCSCCPADTEQGFPSDWPNERRRILEWFANADDEPLYRYAEKATLLLSHTPRYEHDCDRCVFVCQIGRVDVYSCPYSGGLIARESDNPGDYQSGDGVDIAFIERVYNKGN